MAASWCKLFSSPRKGFMEHITARVETMRHFQFLKFLYMLECLGLLLFGSGNQKDPKIKRVELDFNGADWNASASKQA